MDISADEYGYLPLANPFNNIQGANCDTDKNCPKGYQCIGNVCTLQKNETPPPIPFIITDKFMYLGKIIDIPIVSNKTATFRDVTVNNINQSCLFDSDCYPGLWCLNNQNGTGSICLGSGSGNIGASCVNGGDCLVGLDCYQSGTNQGTTIQKSCQMGPIIILP